MRLAAGQVPFDALLITVTNGARNIDMTRYTTVTLELKSPAGAVVSTAGGTLTVEVDGRIRYVWPPVTLFPTRGEYTLRVKGESAGVLDWSDPVRIDVL